MTMSFALASKKTNALFFAALGVMMSGAVHAADAPSPPWLLTISEYVMVGVTFDEATVRGMLPAEIKPVVRDGGVSGLFGVYRMPHAYGLPPYTAGYAAVEIEGFDSADGSKGRWMLQGAYGGAPVAMAIRTRYGWPLGPGEGRLEQRESSKRGTLMIGGSPVVEVEVARTTEGCRSVAGIVHFVAPNPAGSGLIINEIPYTGKSCPATPVSVKVGGSANELFRSLQPKSLTWGAELYEMSVAFTQPRMKR